jgi:hypothetical protein
MVNLKMVVYGHSFRLDRTESNRGSALDTNLLWVQILAKIKQSLVHQI